MKKLLAFLAFAGVAVAAAFYWIFWAGPGPAKGPHTVIVAEGAGFNQVIDQLVGMGAVPGSRDSFKAMAQIFASSDPIQAGEFLIPAGTGGGKVLDILQHGRPIQRLITVPEGMPSILVHERLMANPHLSGTATLPAEGSVLPDTYSFQRGETRAEVLARMQRAMSEELDRLWRQRKPGSVVRSKREAIILASIVEKETAKPSERRMVAGVYSNRLRQGMKLDADPTVIYPITKGRALGRRILKSELRADNGYNTYARAGLPAGPIANPGRESIAAVLNPETTKALYFVADGAGGHAFAATLAEHEANRRKWYAIRRQRGEM